MERVARQRLHGLMERLADGDREAFDPVYVSVRPVVTSFARRVVDDPDDVVQQTMIDIFRNAASFDPSRDALSWILGITAYNCRTANRKRSRRREVPEVDITSETNPEKETIAADLRAALESALGNLSPLDLETIEAVLERRERPAIDPATFRKRLQRAMTRLRRVWGAKHET